MNTIDATECSTTTTRAAANLALNPWLLRFFRLARRAPWVLRLLKPIAVRVAVRASSQIAGATKANALRIYGSQLTALQLKSYSKQVVSNFFQFVLDLAGGHADSKHELHTKIEAVEGRNAYDACRKQGRGVILLTAHIGSYELGLASIMQAEKAVHVVFKRDAYADWEYLRSRMHQRLGVTEAPIDDGWKTWLGLKTALENDEAVVMQADRAWPGQRHIDLPALGGTLRLPVGPVKLAELTQCPIVPVFCVREPGDKYRIKLFSPIYPNFGANDVVREVMQEVASAMQKMIQSYPTQWLMLDPAFVEDKAAEFSA